MYLIVNNVANTDSANNTDFIIGAVTGSVIIAVLVTAILLTILWIKKKVKLIKKTRVLESQNSEASLR